MMWLLDVNLPVALKQTLKGLGIQCETTEAMGWRQLTNGHLARTAIQNGFTAILTRDIEFATSASKSLKDYSEIAVIIIKIPQRKEKIYLELFLQSWQQNPIQPKNGVVLHWP